MELACTRAIQSPADLKGKRIAVQENPSQYYFSLLLKKYNLAPADVSLVRLGPAEMLSALNGGSIDGFVWQEPFLTQAAKIAASARSGLHLLDPMPRNRSGLAHSSRRWIRWWRRTPSAGWRSDCRWKHPS
jgi:ABC-type nitrate/sulfonate/bicarbonate transport system substrate-binding protein